MAAPLLRPSCSCTRATFLVSPPPWPGHFLWSSLVRRLDAMRSLAAIPKVVHLVLSMNADDSVTPVTAEIGSDTNTVAPLALTQALLPLMMRERLIPPATREPVARVVNIGSVVGSVCTPFNDIYSVSKAA
ncbi:hypothetical protein HK405_008659, partial [Cladochytrium tenue]